MRRLTKWLYKKISDYYTRDKPPKRAYLCDFDRICYEVRPGDVLLVEGRNRISRIIQNITKSPWSHAALYIGRIHDIEDAMLRELIHKHYKGPTREQLLVESIVGKGTFIGPLSHYRQDHIRICRPSGLSYRDAQKVIAYAVKHVGDRYNVRHFFDLGRFLLASHFIPKRYGSSIFINEPSQTTKEICSAMIASAFTAIKFPILPLIRPDEQSHQLELIRRNPKLFTPSDFDYSPYFNIIKYPLFPLTSLAPYRQLPWRDEILSNDEYGIVPRHIEELDEEQSKSQDDSESSNKKRE